MGSVFARVRSLLRQENATLFSWISRVGTVCVLMVRSLLRQENAMLFSWISRVGTVCLLW